jgi:protein phosphatase
VSLARLAVPPRERPRDPQSRDVRPAGVRRAPIRLRRLGGPPSGCGRPRPHHGSVLSDRRRPADGDAALATARIAIRDPSVILLVGAAGAGKSTFARHHFRADEILSSDELRGAIRGDPTDQSVTRVAFRILHRELITRLAVGRTVVVDATNLASAARAAIVRRTRPFGVPVIAIVLVPPPHDVRARNAARSSGRVPDDVVDRQLAAAALLGESRAAIAQRLAAEGFAGVHVLASTAEIDRLEVDRVSR